MLGVKQQPKPTLLLCLSASMHTAQQYDSQPFIHSIEKETELKLIAKVNHISYTKQFIEYVSIIAKSSNVTVPNH